MKTFSDNIISINELRRNFGQVEKTLPFVDYFIITKKGRPFAHLTATPTVKKELMKKYAGAFRGTMLENESLWKEVLKRKSRKTDISL